jgi:hypothetical protein
MLFLLLHVLLLLFHQRNENVLLMLVICFQIQMKKWTCEIGHHMYKAQCPKGCKRCNKRVCPQCLEDAALTISFQGTTRQKTLGDCPRCGYGAGSIQYELINSAMPITQPTHSIVPSKGCVNSPFLGILPLAHVVMSYLSPIDTPDAVFSLGAFESLEDWVVSRQVRSTDSPGRSLVLVDGKLHNMGKPAIVDWWNGGTRYYMQRGQLHNEDGPAVIFSSGIVIYANRGRLLRVVRYDENYVSHHWIRWGALGAGAVGGLAVASCLGAAYLSASLVGTQHPAFLGVMSILFTTSMYIQESKELKPGRNLAGLSAAGWATALVGCSVTPPLVGLADAHLETLSFPFNYITFVPACSGALVMPL